MLNSCNEKPEKHFSNAGIPFSEKTMILNVEQDNSIEGTYLAVTERKDDGIVIVKNLRGVDLDFGADEKSWMLGWGRGKPYFDAGNENLRTIKSYESTTGTFILGEILRGQGFPTKGVKVTLWNKNPSGFFKITKGPLLDSHAGWHAFAGENIVFGKIIRDTLRNQWLMYVNETDTPTVHVYAAVSKDLIDWVPARNGEAILSDSDFKNAEWAAKNVSGRQLPGPNITDAIFKDSLWYFFLSGIGKDGNRMIGLAISRDPLNGPFQIHEEALLKPGKPGSWDESACFHPKILKYGDAYLMFYDGYNKAGEEMLGMAFSKDLLHWQKNGNQAVLKGHNGWRSFVNSSEPAHVSARKDSIFLFLVGAKALKNNLQGRVMCNRFMDKPGNVNDNQLGCYLSLDGGKSFVSHKNNPLFINDYSDPFENDHLGACLEWFEKDGQTYLFYVAKTDAQGLAYHPFLRRKKTK